MAALRLLLPLCLAMAAASAQCITSAQDYIDHFQRVLTGEEDPIDCGVADDLMVTIQSQNKSTDPLPTINPRNGPWSWASGNDNLETYLHMAQKHRDDGDQGKGLTDEMIDYVGITGGVDENKDYDLVVFKRSRMEELSFFKLPINPNWNDLWTYLEDEAGLILCTNGTHNLAECPVVTIPLSFTEEVKTELLVEDYETITGCPPDIPNNATCYCSNEDFCTMRTQLWNARNSGTFSCVTSFSESMGAGENAAQTRAFLEICVGCNSLFAGDGYGFNGVMTTGKEWLVRGNAPLPDLEAMRMRLFPV